MNPQLEAAVRALIRQEMNTQQSPFSVAKVPFHIHNGVDAPRLSYAGIVDNPGVFFGGLLNADGTAGAPFPPKWSSAKDGTGNYVVTHNLGTAGYSVVAIVLDSFLTPKVVQIKSADVNSFEYKVGNTGGSASDAKTYFIVVVPTAV